MNGRLGFLHGLSHIQTTDLLVPTWESPVWYPSHRTIPETFLLYSSYMHHNQYRQLRLRLSQYLEVSDMWHSSCHNEQRYCSCGNHTHLSMYNISPTHHSNNDRDVFRLLLLHKDADSSEAVGLNHYLFLE